MVLEALQKVVGADLGLYLKWWVEKIDKLEVRMRGLIIRTHDVARERVIAHRRRKRKDQEHFLSIFKKKWCLSLFQGCFLPSLLFSEWLNLWFYPECFSLAPNRGSQESQCLWLYHSHLSLDKIFIIPQNQTMLSNLSVFFLISKR